MKRKALAGEGLPIRERCNHCHCSFLEVDEELLADLRNCGPHKRCELSEMKAAAEEKSKEKSEAFKKKSKEDYEILLKKETLLMKKRYLEKKAAEKEETEEENKAAEAEGKKKPVKRVAIEKLAVDDVKKKKLSFLIDIEGNVRSKEKVVKKTKVVNF